LRSPLPEIIAEQQAANVIEELAIAQRHVLALDQLPTLHKDPFDRILVAQAICEQAVFVSADSIFAGYPVRVEW
jgi:PIN domain nuclease of toxin-antitoxin system